MRRFVGDESFEAVMPPAPAPNVLSGGAPPAAAVLLTAADKAIGAVTAYETDKNSGDLAPIFKLIWSVIPEGARRPLRVVFRVLAVLAGVALAGVAILFAKGSPPDLGSAAIFGVLALAFILGALFASHIKALAKVTADRFGAISARLTPSQPEPAAKESLFGSWCDQVVEALKRRALALLPAATWMAIGVALFGAVFVFGSLGASDSSGRFIGICSGVIIWLVAALIWKQPAGGVISSGTSSVLMSALMLMFAVILGVEAVSLAGGVKFSWNVFKDYEAVKKGFPVLACGVMAGLFGLAGIALAVNGSRAARTARLLRDLDATAPPLSPAPQSVGLAPMAAPALNLDVYRLDEWPAFVGAYVAPTSAANVVGQPPRNILWLADANSGSAIYRVALGNGRRFGPVCLLADVGDTAVFQLVKMKTEAAVRQARLTTCDVTAPDFPGLSRRPLASGDKDLMGVARSSGGYQRRLFIRRDGDDAAGLQRLCDWAGLTVFDATGSKSDAGAWQIPLLVDRVDAKATLMLVDAETDQAALCALLRKAWSAMSASSPNNRADAAPVRWIVLDPANANPAPRQDAPVEAPAPSAKPKSLLDAMDGAMLRDPRREDRIFTGSPDA